MYVCICKAVTDKQIIKAIEDGCECRQDIVKELMKGHKCGKCVPHLDAIIKVRLEGINA